MKKTSLPLITKQEKLAAHASSGSLMLFFLSLSFLIPATMPESKSIDKSNIGVNKKIQFKTKVSVADAIKPSKSEKAITVDKKTIEANTGGSESKVSPVKSEVGFIKEKAKDTKSNREASSPVVAEMPISAESREVLSSQSVASESLAASAPMHQEAIDDPYANMTIESGRTDELAVLNSKQWVVDQNTLDALKQLPKYNEQNSDKEVNPPQASTNQEAFTLDPKALEAALRKSEADSDIPPFPSDWVAKWKDAGSGIMVVGLLVDSDGIVKNSVLVKGTGNHLLDQIYLNSGLQIKFDEKSDGIPFVGKYKWVEFPMKTSM